MQQHMTQMIRTDTKVFIREKLKPSDWFDVLFMNTIGKQRFVHLSMLLPYFAGNHEVSEYDFEYCAVNASKEQPAETCDFPAIIEYFKKSSRHDDKYPLWYDLKKTIHVMSEEDLKLGGLNTEVLATNMHARVWVYIQYEYDPSKKRPRTDEVSTDTQQPPTKEQTIAH